VAHSRQGNGWVSKPSLFEREIGFVKYCLGDCFKTIPYDRPPDFVNVRSLTRDILPIHFEFVLFKKFVPLVFGASFISKSKFSDTSFVDWMNAELDEMPQIGTKRRPRWTEALKCWLVQRFHNFRHWNSGIR